MQEKLLQIKNAALSLITQAQTEEEIQHIYFQLFGKQGKVTLALKEIVAIPKDERGAAGKTANEIRTILLDIIKRKQEELSKEFTKKKRKHIDVTNPGIQPSLGHLHLITQAIEEITTIFEHVGFSRVRHPEIEWDWYAFTSLNFPENHPARDDWETFFTTASADKKMGSVILTPHTSSGQVREMLKGKLPIKMLNIAKCYRRQSDISHTQMFHQFEGLVVGENISIQHLKGVLEYFAKSYFGEKRASRIRPYHFQFTEPSFEVDVSCGVCNGKGILADGQKCRLCKSGWLEIGGAGMVHPNVLRYGGIDPEKYTGFAFGWGVERVLMMKEGLVIDDLRLLYSNNLEFLEQF